MISALDMWIRGAWILKRVPSTAGLGRELRELLESRDELRAAIGIPRVIDSGHTDEDIAGPENLRPAEREREHQRIARRDVGDRDTRGGRFRHGHFRIGQCRAADTGEIDAHDAVLARAERCRELPRRRELRHVALPVIDTERVAFEAAAARDGERRGGIEAAGQQTRPAAFWPSFARHIAPQHLVELQLKSHRQPVGENPVCERRGRHLGIARREQHLAALAQRVLLQIRPAPVIVLA